MPVSARNAFWVRTGDTPNSPGRKWMCVVPVVGGWYVRKVRSRLLRPQAMVVCQLPPSIGRLYMTEALTWITSIPW